MESSLRPRDIQARIRSGASPEQVAAAAQTTIDKVMGYAVPVLAERAHIAGRAQRATVRRVDGEAPTRVLADAVAERLRGRGVDPAAVEWDAWRRDDGRWALVADYRSGESARHAEFVFDVRGSYVLADDDEARWLVGEPTAVTGPQPRSTPGPRRLSAVGQESELPLGEDAIELVSQERRAPAAADWIATQATERPMAVQDPVAVADAEHQGGSEAADEEAVAEEPTAAAAVGSRRRRASVPSWDEIMFGGAKRE